MPMATTLFQVLGVGTPSFASSHSNKFLLPSRSERKDGIFVVRSDAARVLKTEARKHELLVTNAVATKGGASSAASTSKSGSGYRCKWKHCEECGKLATASSYH